MRSLRTGVVIGCLLAPEAVLADEQRPLVLSVGARGLGFLYNGSDLAGGPGASVGLVGLGYFRVEADFSHVATSNQDDGYLVGFLLSAQYPSIASQDAVFLGLGFAEWLMNDNTPFLRAAIGYAFTWRFILLRAAWEPHLGFFPASCEDCFDESFIELITTTLVSFSLTVGFGIDLL